LSKLKVYHFNNGSGGGVFSVINNLIKFSNNPDIENHIIYTINIEKTPFFSIQPVAGAVTEKVFYYSPKWNFYYTSGKLARLLPAENILLVAHDWLELGMVSNLGLRYKVVYFVHGAYDYYYKLAQLHTHSIDKFITVAKNIETKLAQLLPQRKSDIIYVRFPVPAIDFEKKKGEEEINIIFAARLEYAKGYPLIPLIANELLKKAVKFCLHIVGPDMESTDKKVVWNENINVCFYGNISNEKVVQLLKSMHIILLPSLYEGMPVILVESMKAGVIPIVNNIEGGIQELVFENETGYKIDNNAVGGYVEKISHLASDPFKISAMQNNCISLANRLFNPVDNTVIIEDIFLKTELIINNKKSPVKIYGSRLDKQWIPNGITKLIRIFTNR
jgi:glycosyltransferase involved in cell wall biosynthesis